jgi:thiol:disulfide interchange protein
MKNLYRLAILAISLCGFVQPSTAQQSTAPGAQKGLSSLFSNPREDELIDPEQAFRISVAVTGPNVVTAQLMPAKGYYLYKERIKFSLKDSPGVAITTVRLPTGESKTDQIYGKTEVYKKPVAADLMLNRAAKANRATLVASYQGCHEKLGVCYPPVEKTVTLTLP